MSNLWAVIVAYLLGSIPTGLLVARWAKGVDIRAVGSGNIGATNVGRGLGLRWGVAVLALDAGKGLLAVWLAGRITGNSLVWMAAAALAAMAGNAFSIWLRFRGGKTVATGTGAFALVAPLPLLAVAVVFALAAGVSRQISAGSIAAAATFPLAIWLIAHPRWEVVAVSIGTGALVLWRHRENIRRIREGTEPRFTIRGR